MNMEEYIDHTLLKADATSGQIKQLCQEAKQHQFATVCINPSWIPLAKKELTNSNVKICTVIGFPLGANSSASKVFEAQDAISMGADELDMVIHIGKAKEGDFAYIEAEIQAIVGASGGRVVKVILETSLLSNQEIELATQAAVRAKASFVKTSTGFSTGGATIEAVSLMKRIAGDACGVKASGGVRTAEDFYAMIKAGATRIGTSAGVALMQGKENNSNY